MRSLFLILLTLFVSSSALARVSEFNYQAVEGESFVESNFSFTSGELSTEGTSVSLDITDMILDLKYETGINENTAWYFAAGYGDGEIESDDFTGVLPVSTGLKIQSVSEKGRFLSLIDLSVEVEKAKEDNRSGAVMALTLGLGYEHFLGETYLLGYSAKYAFLTTDFKDDVSTDVSATKGAFDASVYFEKVMNELTLGSSVGYYLGSIAQLSNYSVDVVGQKGDEFGYGSFSAYGRYDLSDKLSLRGSISYATIVNTSNVLDSGDSFGASVGARYKF